MEMAEAIPYLHFLDLLRVIGSFMRQSRLQKRMQMQCNTEFEFWQDSIPLFGAILK